MIPLFTRQRFRTVLVTSMAVLFFSAPAFPWGRMGYRLAAKMAQDRLSPAALSAVQDLLGPKTTLVDIATWAVEQEAVPDTSSWHYVKVPITESRYDPKYCPRGGCVVSKIIEFRRVLENHAASKAEKQRALKFLVNLMADLHQPLNVGDTGSDRGKLIQVLFYGKASNLYQVWDSLIIEHYSTIEGVWLWEMTGRTSLEKKAQWSRGTPGDWATESLEVAKRAYCLPGQNTVMKSGTKLGNEYTGIAVPIIQEQLAKAGVRTAWVLNEIFK